jgi:mono/diheme cytochrome c family protein
MRGWGTWAAALAAIGAIGCARNLAPPREIDLEYEGPIRSRDIVEGGRIYTTLCTACHRGRVNPRGYSWSPGQMRHQIREGNRLMPPLSDELLSDTQVEAVLAYLSVMGALDGDLPPVRNGELDLDEELADAELEDEERELVGATESPELPAAPVQTDPSPAESSATEPQTAGASGAEPATTVVEPRTTASDGAREGATGLAPPSGDPTDTTR